jgi:cell division septum initiation protein DivIVA
MADNNLNLLIAEMLGDTGKLYKEVQDLKRTIPILTQKIVHASKAIDETNSNATINAIAIAKNDAYWLSFVSGTVLAILFGLSGYCLRYAFDVGSLQRSKELLVEANARADTAVASAKESADQTVDEIRKVSGWAGTNDGRLAKQFFDDKTWKNAMKCNSPHWNIVVVSNEKWCVPTRRPILGGDDEQQYGWKIP